jgi:hypothetical protein
MERSGKAKQTVIIRRKFLLVGRRNRTAVSLMQAQLRQQGIIKSGSLGKLSTNCRNEQRLRDKRVDRYRADQASPEAPSRIRLISLGSHAHELVLLHRAQDTLDQVTWFADGFSWYVWSDFEGLEPHASIVGSIRVATLTAWRRSRKFLDW